MSKYETDNDILLKQKRMKMGFFSAVLMIMVSLQWITVDMYLPALPVLKESFRVSEASLNISLNAGIVATAIGTLVSGPISDRYGRKPVMIIGLMLSAFCTAACALAEGVAFLSVMRGLAGLGGGAIETVSASMVKDSYTGKKFQKVMTVMQAATVIGPVLAPALGALVINNLSWEFIFIFLGAAMVISGIPIVISTETWPKEIRVANSLKETLHEGSMVMKSRFFVMFLGVMLFITIPLWGYIGVSSYIFITECHQSNLMYSLLYGIGAAVEFFAPFIYLWIVRKTGDKVVAGIGVVLMTLSGLLIMIFCSSGFGFSAAVVLLLCLLPMLLSEGMIRPQGMVVLLEDQKNAVGSATAIIYFALNMVGMVGTTLTTLAWSSFRFGTGLITFLCGVFAVVVYGVIVKKRMM